MKNVLVTVITVLLLLGTVGCRSKRVMSSQALPEESVQALPAESVQATPLESVQAGSTEVEVPFTGREFRSDANFFRATQNGLSPDLSTARRIAMLNAKNELASAIETTMKAVSVNYTNQRTMSYQQEFANRFEEEVRAVVNQTLNDVAIIGERTFREFDGRFMVYVALEMNREVLLQKLNNQMLKDERMRLDFDQDQFHKLFDEEMQKNQNR